MEDYTLGTIMPWPADFAPQYWAFCHGQMMAVRQNQALFSLIGSMYGGDGRVTFALPDLRGRVIVAFGSAYRQGANGGYEWIVPPVNALPAHSHSFQFAASSDAEANTNDPTIGSGVYAQSARNAYAFSGQQAMQAVTSTSTGFSQPVTVMQPFLALNYIICLDGYFPSRQ